jgi:hypothetical protein
MASRDLYTYESTPDYPQNITVIDFTTGEKLLSIEVPVGQQLVIRFYEDHDTKNTARPDLMRWKLMPRGTQFGELPNSMPVPDYNHRRVDVTLRKEAEAVPKPANVPPPEVVTPPPPLPTSATPATQQPPK